MEPEASELPKNLVLGRDENIHIRITPLGDVGSYNTTHPEIFIFNGMKLLIYPWTFCVVVC